MGDEREKTAPSMKSGVLPRVDQQEIRAMRESKRPATVPEMDEDAGGITGVVILNAEGEDAAKQDDDHASEG